MSANLLKCIWTTALRSGKYVEIAAKIVLTLLNTYTAYNIYTHQDFETYLSICLLQNSGQRDNKLNSPSANYA